MAGMIEELVMEGEARGRKEGPAASGRILRRGRH